MAGALFAIRIQGAEIDQARHMVLQAGVDDLLAQFRVHLPEATAVMAFFIQYSDQVDDRVATFEQRVQRFLPVNIALSEL